jgi:hypothetical protein
MRFYVPLLSELTEPQYHLLLFLQAIVLKHAAEAIPRILDTDVAEATAAAAATLETAGKGVIYEHRPASIPAQRLADELQRALNEISRQGRAPKLERDAAVALRRLEQGARTAAASLPDDEAPVFLGVLGRLMHGADAADATTEAQPARESPLIIPG